MASRLVHFAQNNTKSNDFITKYFKQKLFRIRFPTENQWIYKSTSLRNEAKGLHRWSFLKYYNALELESRFTSGLNAAKNTDYNKKSFEQKLFKIKFLTKNTVDA